MLRTISILALLICSAASMAGAKPIFIKVFAPSSGASSVGYSYGSTSTVTAAPFVSQQLVSNLISTKIQLLNSVLQAKTSGGGFGFGFNKFVSFSGSTTTTTTARPVTYHTTEVNTDFTPEDSSTQTTQTVYTTTTEGDIETPKPTVHPGRPVSTSTTEVIAGESTTEVAEISSTTRAPSGYSYTSPTPGLGPVPSTVGTYYLPSSLA